MFDLNWCSLIVTYIRSCSICDHLKGEDPESDTLNVSWEFISNIQYLIFTVGYSSVGFGSSVGGRGGGKGRSGMSLLQLRRIILQVSFKMLIIILFMINLVFVGVDWWWLLTDLRRRSRLLLQSGNLHGCCPCWRCNRHLRGPRRLPKNRIASTWRSRLNQSYVRQGDFADSAPTEYCTTFHFPSACPSTGVTFYICPMYKSIYATWIIRGPMDSYMI